MFLGKIVGNAKSLIQQRRTKKGRAEDGPAFKIFQEGLDLLLHFSAYTDDTEKTGTEEPGCGGNRNSRGLDIGMIPFSDG